MHISAMFTVRLKDGTGQNFCDRTRLVTYLLNCPVGKHYNTYWFRYYHAKQENSSIHYSKTALCW